MTALEAVNRMDFLRAYEKTLEDIIYDDNLRDDVVKHFETQIEEVHREIKDIETKLSKTNI